MTGAHNQPMHDLVAVKHNALVTGRSNLSLVGQRVMATVLATIDSRAEWDGRDGRYTIDFTDVMDFIDSKHDNKRQQMMKATSELMQKIVTIQVKDLDEDIIEKYRKIQLEEGEDPINFEGDTIQTSWLLGPIRYTFGVDKLKVKIDKFLMPFLIEISKNFTKIQLREAVKLKSKYGFRLFEILSRYEFRSKVDIGYHDLREMLGIDSETYQRFTNFYTRVLSVAVQDIGDNTSLRFSVKINKKFGRVDSVTFANIGREKSIEQTAQPEAPPKPTGYPPELTADLKARGIQHLAKWTKEGITAEHWRKVLPMETTDPKHLITEARKVRDMAEAEKTKAQDKMTKAQTIAKNRKWFDEHRTDLDGWDDLGAYVMGRKGAVKFIETDFQEKLKAHPQKR